MNQIFKRIPRTTISRAELIAQTVKLWPSVEDVIAERPTYTALTTNDVKDFLRYTEIDKYNYRFAEINNPEEFERVCVSYSLLLWALSEQQRQFDSIMYPVTIGRVTLYNKTIGAPGHSMNCYVNVRTGRIIEPQDDKMTRYAPEPYYPFRIQFV